MSHTKMIDAFSVVIQNSLSLYEEQTPLYYYLTIYGSWVLTALSILSLASVFFTIGQKKPYRFVVPILFLWLGYEGIHMPRPNLAVFYGISFLKTSSFSWAIRTSFPPYWRLSLTQLCWILIISSTSRPAAIRSTMLLKL